MSVMKFKGHTGASGKNVDYIMRDSACQDLSFHNLDELQGQDEHESKINARSYAYNREDEEKGRTHYRVTLTWEGKEDTAKAREMSQEYLKENFKDSRAIVAVHQDTNKTHAHIWIDSRQLNDRKIHSPRNHINELSQSWQTRCDREYGTNRAKEFAEKREESRRWREDRHNGKDTPKPERAQMTSEKWREKDQQDRGVKSNVIDKEGLGRNQRPFEVRNSKTIEADRALAGSQRQFTESKHNFEQSNQKVIGSQRHFEQSNQATAGSQQQLDQSKQAINRSQHQVERADSQARDTIQGTTGLHQSITEYGRAIKEATRDLDRGIER
jgi:hypothetical protein